MKTPGVIRGSRCSILQKQGDEVSYQPRDGAQFHDVFLSLLG